MSNFAEQPSTMKKRFLNFGLILITVFLVACAKDNTEPEDPAQNPDKGSFSWQTNPGGNNTVADSAFYYAQFTTILAFKNGNSNSLEMTLASLAPGTYSLSSTTGNTFEFVSGSTTYAGSGTCVISSASNGKLSGSFNVTLSGGSLTGINGSFSGILQK